MTDALTEIADNNRRIKKLTQEGKVIRCPICWNPVNNNKDKLIEHINYYHTYTVIIDRVTDLWIDIWNNDTNKMRSFFEND